MEKFVTPGGAVLRYTDNHAESDKAPVVLMHGWGCTHQTLLPIERMIAQLGRRIINVDFPGFGLSPEPDTIWGVEEYASQIEQLLDSLNVEKPVLLGHSFGGRVGILIASRRPLDKLVLVDAAGIKSQPSRRQRRRSRAFKAVKRLCMLLPDSLREAALEKARRRFGSADYRSSTPQMRAIMSKVINEDLTALLPEIKCPTLLLWGEDDTATPLSDAKTMERLIPDAGLVAMPGCGHYSFLAPPYGNPVVTEAALKSFLA